jgi:hypothetical protein
MMFSRQATPGTALLGRERLIPVRGILGANAWALAPAGLHLPVFARRSRLDEIWHRHCGAPARRAPDHLARSLSRLTQPDGDRR